jgi:predicted RNase H-related nuclease YkuK (DUF458 family)
MSVFTENQIQEIVDLLCELDTNTKIYIGTDSIKFKKNGLWYAKFATVCVVHRNGKNGCTVFKKLTTEVDYEKKKNKPSVRLMREVMKSCELYTQLAPFIDGFDIEIHVDISTDEKNGSSCVVKEAAGLVLGMVGSLPKFKPEAWCAATGADHFARM